MESFRNASGGIDKESIPPLTAKPVPSNPDNRNKNKEHQTSSQLPHHPSHVNRSSENVVDSGQVNMMMVKKQKKAFPKVAIGTTIRVMFRGANPRNNQHSEGTFLTVEKWVGDSKALEGEVADSERARAAERGASKRAWRREGGEGVERGREVGEEGMVGVKSGRRDGKKEGKEGRTKQGAGEKPRSHFSFGVSSVTAAEAAAAAAATNSATTTTTTTTITAGTGLPPPDKAPEPLMHSELHLLSRSSSSFSASSSSPVLASSSSASVLMNVSVPTTTSVPMTTSVPFRNATYRLQALRAAATLARRKGVLYSGHESNLSYWTHVLSSVENRYDITALYKGLDVDLFSESSALERFARESKGNSGNLGSPEFAKGARAERKGNKMRRLKEVLRKGKDDDASATSASSVKSAVSASSRDLEAHVTMGVSIDHVYNEVACEGHNRRHHYFDIMNSDGFDAEAVMQHSWTHQHRSARRNSKRNLIQDDKQIVGGDKKGGDHASDNGPPSSKATSSTPSSWKIILTDNDWSTKMHWWRSFPLSPLSYVSITWDTGYDILSVFDEIEGSSSHDNNKFNPLENIKQGNKNDLQQKVSKMPEPGIYRICYFGDAKSLTGRIKPFEGCSSPFNLVASSST